MGGGAAGFQFGIKQAVLKNYKYIWIMDDDTLPNPDSLAKLLEADQKLKGNYGFLSSTVYWTNGHICRANRQKPSLFTHINEKDLQKQKMRVTMASFVSLFVPAKRVKEVGLPIGQYFIWTDDYEFTGRLSRKYPCYFIPESSVVHAMKANKSADVSNDSIDRMNRYHCLFRNDVHCYRQFGFKGWLYILCKDAGTVVKILLKSDQKKIRIKTVVDGYKEGLKFQPEVERV